MTKPDERRINIRHPFYSKVNLSDTVSGYLRNVSTTGARVSIVSEAPFKAGDVVWFETIDSVEGAPHLLAKGKFMWAKVTGPYCDMGVEFEPTDEKMKENIKKFADYLGHSFKKGKLPPGIEVEIMEQPPFADME